MMGNPNLIAGEGSYGGTHWEILLGGGKYADRHSGYLLPAEGSMKPVGGRVKTGQRQQGDGGARVMRATEET